MFAGSRMPDCCGWILLKDSWNWLQKTSDGYESASTTIRNLGLVIVLPLAIWRVWVADRQATTAQRGLLSERFEKGSEMLGSEVPAVRLGGIYALLRLAREDPDEYYMQIIRLWCAFVRHPTDEKEKGSELIKTEAGTEQDYLFRLRPDVQTIMAAVGSREKKHIALEKINEFKLNFGGASLNGLLLPEGNLAGASLWRVDLSNAWLRKSDLSGASFWEANLTNANLSEANLSLAEGLTQSQLDKALAEPDNPPKLDGAIDYETGEQLVWRGKPLNE